MLLALVFGFVLVLVGVTASALVAVASAHLSSSTLQGVVTRDASLVELFVNANVVATDVDADGPSRARRTELSELLGHLTADDAILRIEIRSPDGVVLASDDAAVVGQVAPRTSAIVGRRPISSLRAAVYRCRRRIRTRPSRSSTCGRGGDVRQAGRGHG